MRLRHKVPCSECPWRKTSPAGWLGGYSPEFYADCHAHDEAPACHNQDHGPDDPRTAFYVGSLATAANSCKSLWKSPGADEAKRVVGKRDDCFGHASQFYEHHAGGKPYVHPLMRG